MHGGTTDRYLVHSTHLPLHLSVDILGLASCGSMLVRLAAFPGSIQESIQGRIQGSAWPSGCALPPHLCMSFPLEVGCFSKVMIASSVILRFCIVSWSSNFQYICTYSLLLMQGLELLRITAPCPLWPL